MKRAAFLCLLFSGFLIAVSSGMSYNQNAMEINSETDEYTDYSYDTEHHEQSTSDRIYCDSAYFSEEYLRCLTKSQVFHDSNEVEITMSYSTETFLETNIIKNGVTIILEEVDTNSNTINICVSIQNTSASLDLRILKENGDEISKTLFFEKESSNFIGFSHQSKDEAKLILYEYLLSIDQITIEQKTGLVNDLYEKSVEIKFLKSSYAFFNSPLVAKIFEGSLNWKDDLGISHPAQFVKVGIKYHKHWTPWHQWLETYSEHDGDFSINLPYSDIDFNRDISIHIFAEGVNINVKPSESSASYEYTSQIKQHVQNGTKLNMTINMTSDFGKAFQIAQAAITSSNYIGYLENGITIRHCSFVYPNDDGTYYSKTKNTVFIGANDNPSPINSYASWDTIGHEYGHHVQNVYETTASDGGTHYINTNMCEIYKNGVIKNGIQIIEPHSDHDAKSKGIRIAWAEGWATFFSISANNHFSKMGYLENISTVGDSLYTSSNGINEDLDSYYKVKGEGNESVISSLLYKMSSIDSTYDPSDKVSISDKELWQSVKILKAKTLSPFIFELYSNERTNSRDIGILLSRYGIAPSIIGITFDSIGNTPPTISWIKNGSSTSFSNTSFELYIYDGTSYPLICKNLENVDSYTLSENEWMELQRYGGISAIVIYGSDENYYVTGPYISPIFTSDIKISIMKHDYEFTNQYTTSEIEKNISFDYCNQNYVVKTTRLRAGHIQNEHIVLSPRQKNAGTALLSYEVEFPVDRVSFDLSLWSADEMLYSHTSTALIQYKNSAGNWITALDLLNDVSLSTDRNNLETYYVEFPSVYEFRIYTTSLQSGTNNKGRICIGNIEINY